jgi:TolB-like protein/Tfp pilus assembly protein PilF
MPNKLSQFWQELKRRNVVRVITVYTASAFVVLELVDIIGEPFGLPNWTLKFVFVVLAVGLVVSIFLSWIYDIHPERGIVKTEPDQKVEPQEAHPSSNSWKIASYISFAVIVGLILLNIVPRSKDSGIAEILDKSIAVLPFENLSEESGNEYFVDGLVDDLLNRISLIEELKVISRTSSEMYREKGDKSVPQIAEELKVAYILEGSVQRYGQKARVTVQLIDAKNDDHIWADSYDRDIEDIFQTQSEIALKIASELDEILTAEQKLSMQEEKTSNIEAFELYQMGRFYWNKRTGDGYAKSIEYFEQAIETDPGYGLAYAGLADTYILMAIQGYIDRWEGRDKGQEMALRALELDGSLGEAYTVLGQMYDYVDWEWEKAENAFQRALTLNPNYSTAHKYYAEHLYITGQNDKARMHMDKTVELDPLSFVVRYTSAQFSYHQGYFEEALRELDICDELEEDHPWMPRYRFYCYWQLGQEKEAYKALRRWLQLNPGYDLETAEEIYNNSDLKAVLEWIVETHRIMSGEAAADSVNVAGYASISKSSILALLGRNDEALTYLESAFQSHRGSPWINFNINYIKLHDDPRFQAILRGMGLRD